MNSGTNRVQKLLKLTLIVYVIYLVLALLVITPALNIFPARYVQDNYDRDLQIRLVWLNPFTLSLEIRRLALPEPSGEQFVTLDSASVNLSLTSVFREGVVLDALRVSDLYVHGSRITEDNFNFSDFMVTDDSASQPEEPGAIPAITVSEVDLHAKTIKLTDLSREQPWTSQWHELHIQAEDLSTVLVEGKPYTIELSNEGGGSLRWEGIVSIPNSESAGKLQISGLNLHNFWRFAEPWVQFELADGSLDIGAQYRINWEDAFSFYIGDGSVELQALDVRPKDGVDLPDTQITLGQLSVRGIEVNSEALSVDVRRIDIDGLDVFGYSQGDIISLQALFAVDDIDSEEPATPPVSNNEAPSDKPEQDWKVRLAAANLGSSKIEWRSDYTEPTLMIVNPIELELTSLSWPPIDTSEIALAISLNKQTTLALQGNVHLGTGNAELHYTLERLHLPWFNPSIPERIKAKLTTGELQMEGDAVLADFSPTHIKLNAVASDFQFEHKQLENVPYGGWTSIAIDGLDLDIERRALVLQNLKMNGLDARVIIDSDGTLNTSRMLEEPSAASEAKSAATEAGSDAQPWSVEIPTIVLHNSQVDFSDESLTRSFRTNLEDVEAEILGLSSKPGAPATINITGAVGGYAPISVTGNLKPLQSPPELDLVLSLDGLDMSRYTAYSGTYTGYAIDRGLVDVELKYSLHNNQLKGKNLIVTKNLTLGDKLDSDRALNVPLKLALSLLTDNKGLITLNVPVSGNMEDPKFGLGNVIVSAFTSVLISAATSPFSVLAGIVNSDDDFRTVVFGSGSAELNSNNREKLAELASALTMRAKLSLVISGQLHPEADLKRLQRNALDVQLRASGLTQEDIDSRTTAWNEVVSKRYRKLDDASDDASPSTAQEQYRQIATATDVPQDTLDALVADRAEAVRKYLVDEAGLAAERVQVDPDRINVELPPISGVQLILEI
ncbi:MAG: hypothetical protein ACI9NT_001009 [Bacteroidia bacterium]